MKKLPRHVEYVNKKVRNKYTKTLRKVKSKIRTTEDKSMRKDLEVEVSYIENQVNNYGFTFFPDVYVEECIKQLKDLL